MELLRAVVFKKTNKSLLFFVFFQFVCLRMSNWAAIEGEATKIRTTDDGDKTDVFLALQSAAPSPSAPSSWPSLRAIVHLHSPSSSPTVSDLQTGGRETNGDRSVDEAHPPAAGGGEEKEEAGGGGEEEEITFISEKEEKKKKRPRQAASVERAETAGVDAEGGQGDEEKFFFSALQVGESSQIGVQSFQRERQASSSSSFEREKSSPPPPPSHCACEFSGNCLPKGSCLAIAFTLAGALLIFVIFVAWMLQWVIAIPSEWIIAKGRYAPKRRTSSAGGRKEEEEEEDEGRESLLDEQKRKSGDQASPSSSRRFGEEKNVREEEAMASRVETEEREEEERRRRISEGGGGSPPPSRIESGRL